MKASSILFLAIMNLCIMKGLAQESINCGGFQTEGLSFSIGAPFFTNNQGLTGSFQEGVQQVYYQPEVTHLKEEETFAFSIYPIPARQEIFIRPEGEQQKYFSYCIYDLCGRLVSKPLQTKGESKVNVSSFSPGCYLLEIEVGNKKTIEPILIQ
jgi:hypothetical protein